MGSIITDGRSRNKTGYSKTKRSYPKSTFKFTRIPRVPTKWIDNPRNPYSPNSPIKQMIYRKLREEDN